MINKFNRINHLFIILIACSFILFMNCGQGMDMLLVSNSKASFVNWNNSIGIRINSSQVSDDLTNFPVLISFASNASLQANARSDGFDILFTDNSSNQLDHEIEKYDSSNGQLVAWVKVPFLSSSVDTEIYLYYGNPSANDQSNRTGVWDSNHLTVLHMNNDPSGIAPQIQDSTNNNNDFTNTSGLTSGDLVNAKIGDGINFNEDTLDRSDVLGGPSNVTLSAWVNFTGPNNAEVINLGNNLGLRLDDTIQLGTQCFWRRSTGSTYDFVTSGQYVAGTGWRHVAATFDSESNTQKVYVDGTLFVIGTFTSNIVYQDTTLTRIGLHTNGSIYHFYGIIDEVKISNVARSEAWIKTEYNNQNNPSGFYSIF